MKRLLMTFALTSVLSVSAMAGDVHTGDSPAPAPATTQTTITTAPGSSLSAPGAITTSDAARQMSETALSALLTLFGLVV